MGALFIYLFWVCDLCGCNFDRATLKEIDHGEECRIVDKKKGESWRLPFLFKEDSDMASSMSAVECK